MKAYLFETNSSLGSSGSWILYCMEMGADIKVSRSKGVVVADPEKTLQHLLACTVPGHIWQIGCIQIFRIRHMIARICSCLHKQIRAGQTHVERGFTVKRAE